MVKTGRNTKIDALKGVAIFLVILGHVIQLLKYGTGEDAVQNILSSTSGKIIYLVHMPMFIFLSGYLQAKRLKLSSFSDIVKSLIVPMTIWGIAFTGLNMALGLTQFTVVNMCHALFAYWFIWALLICIVFTKIGFIIDKKVKNMIVSLVIAYILLLLLPDIRYYNSYICYAKCLFPFFAAGILFKEHSILTRIDNRGTLCLSIYIGAIVFVHYDWFIYFLNPNIIPHFTSNLYTFVKVGFLFVAGMAGIFVFYWLLEDIYRFRRLSFIEKFGQYTLSIYFIQHIIINSFFVKWNFLVENPIALIVISIIISLVVYLVIKVIERNKFLTKRLLGK